MIRTPPGDYDEEGNEIWTPNIHGNNGSLHGVSGDPKKRDGAQLLREVVEEITNGRIPAPPKRRIGFL